MRLQKCIHFYSAITATKAMSKKPTFFKGDLVALLAAALSPVSTWMGDRLEPRSKSELQLEIIIFSSLFFFISSMLWAFSRYFQP